MFPTLLQAFLILVVPVPLFYLLTLLPPSLFAALLLVCPVQPLSTRRAAPAPGVTYTGASDAAARTAALDRKLRRTRYEQSAARDEKGAMLVDVDVEA